MNTTQTMNEQTLERLRTLRLTGMYHLLKTSLDTDRTTTLTPDAWLHQLVEAEWDERQNRSIDQRIRLARFRYRAAVEELLRRGAGPGPRTGRAAGVLRLH